MNFKIQWPRENRKIDFKANDRQRAIERELKKNQFAYIDLD